MPEVERQKRPFSALVALTDSKHPKRIVYKNWFQPAISFVKLFAAVYKKQFCPMTLDLGEIRVSQDGRHV